jgi:hypothetical protein
MTHKEHKHLGIPEHEHVSQNYLKLVDNEIGKHPHPIHPFGDKHKER